MLSTVLSILGAIAAFLFIIFIHELGHFLAAKWSKIRVSEFAIGMGPKIFSWGKGETKYSLRAIPLGGFCAMAEDETADLSDESAFRNKPVHKRFITIAAGGIFNILLGFILMFTFITIQSAPDSTALETPIVVPQIERFASWANSNDDGLQEGDRITHVNGQRIFTATDVDIAISRNGEYNMQNIRIVREGERLDIDVMLGVSSVVVLGGELTHAYNGFGVGDIIRSANGERIFTAADFFEAMRAPHDRVFEIIRSDKFIEVTILEEWEEVISDEDIKERRQRDFALEEEGKNPWTISREATGQTVSMVRWIYVSLLDLVTGNVGSDEIAGPVGVIDQTAQAARMGGGMILFWMGMLSINLGVINLLPIPALDGARLVFLGIEGIRRKPIKPEHEGKVHLIGFIVLIGLILLLTFNDILRLIQGG